MKNAVPHLKHLDALKNMRNEMVQNSDGYEISIEQECYQFTLGNVE